MSRHPIFRPICLLVCLGLPLGWPTLPTHALDPSTASAPAASASRADNYAQALAQAKTTGQSIVVFQRGSDWNQAGEVLYHQVWQTDAFARALGGQYILVAVDHPEVLGGHAVQGQCTARYCGATGLSETPIGNSAPLRLMELANDRAPLPPCEITALKTAEGSTYKRRPDGAWLADGAANPARETLTLQLKPKTGGQVLRLDFPTDPSLPGNGPGRASNGNFVLSEVTLTDAQGKPVKAVAAWADAHEKDWGPWQAIDGIADQAHNLWNAMGYRHQRCTLLVALDRTVKPGSEISVGLTSRSPWGQHTPGCLRAALLTDSRIHDDLVRVAEAQLTQSKNACFDWWDTGLCPRIALMDSLGRAVAADDTPRIGLTAQTMARHVQALRAVQDRRDALWTAAGKKTGPERAEWLRRGLAAMNIANWPGNGRCYAPIHAEIKAADPKDESGAVRWLGFDKDPRQGVPWAAKPNWNELISKPGATDADFTAALKTVDDELHDPRNNLLDHEQIQRIMVAKFLIFKRWPGHEEQSFEAQREIARFDPGTFWGVGAVGYIGMHKKSETPMLTYGWAPNQLKPGMQTWNMTDTAVQFDHAGRYTLTFTHTHGADSLKIRRLMLLDGGLVVAKTGFVGDVGPANKRASATLDCSQWRPDRHYVLRAVVTAAPDHLDNAGTIEVTPEFDPPAGWRPAKAAYLHVSAHGQTPAKMELVRLCADPMKKLAADPAGKAFLEAFTDDIPWMESFLASGPANFPQALDNLCFLHTYAGDEFKNPVLRRLATAMALNVGANYPRYRLMDRFKATRNALEAGLLHADFEKYTVREMRWATLMSGSAAEYQFLLNDRQMTAGDYLGACWQIRYLGHNVYGDSVQDWTYITPWTHAYGLGLGDRPFVAHRQVGGVCGTLSGYGCTAARAHGVPAFTVGQPAHCAYIVRVGDRWPLGNDVSGPGSTGFAVPGWDGTGYSTATELWEQVEGDRTAFMNARRLVWRAHEAMDRSRFDDARRFYERAIQAQPMNYETWLDHLKALAKTPRFSDQKWNEMALRAAKQFAPHNQAGWALVMRCLDQSLPAMTPAKRAAVLLACHRELTQDAWQKPVPYDYNRVLDWQAERIGDPDQAVAFFGELLAIHRGDPSANNWLFSTTLNWGVQRFAGQPATAKAYAQTMEKFLKTRSGELGPAAMSTLVGQGIRNAGKAGDLDSFRRWTRMASQLLPKVTPGDLFLTPAQAAAAPKIAPFPGVVLSKDGLLQTSSACPHDRPLSYAGLLDTGLGGWFDTNDETHPWAQVQLAGDAALSGIVLTNRYEYGPKQAEFEWAAPLKVSVSTDGKSWIQVARFEKAAKVFRVDLQDKNPRARFVRIERVAPADGSKPSTGRFHFRHFVVYGKKLY